MDNFLKALNVALTSMIPRAQAAGSAFPILPPQQAAQAQQQSNQTQAGNGQAVPPTPPVGPVSYAGGIYGSSMEPPQGYPRNYPFFQNHGAARQLMFQNGVPFDMEGHMVGSDAVGQPQAAPNGVTAMPTPPQLTFQGGQFVDPSTGIPYQNFANSGAGYLSTAFGYMPPIFNTAPHPNNPTEVQAYQKSIIDALTRYGYASTNANTPLYGYNSDSTRSGVSQQHGQ